MYGGDFKSDFIEACYYGELTHFDNLLEKVDQSTKQYGFKLAASRNHDHIVKILIQSGIDINSKDANGNTVLMNASLDGLIHIVETLLEAGANVNLKNNDGQTALINAVINKSSNSFIVARALVEAGANVGDKNNEGKSALDIAREKGKNDIVNYLTNVINTLKAEGRQIIRHETFYKNPKLTPAFTNPYARSTPGDLIYRFLSNKEKPIGIHKANVREKLGYARPNYGGRRSTRRHKRSKRKTTHRRRR